MKRTMEQIRSIESVSGEIIVTGESGGQMCCSVSRCIDWLAQSGNWPVVRKAIDDWSDHDTNRND